MFIAMKGHTNLFRSSWHGSQGIRELSQEETEPATEKDTAGLGSSLEN